MPSTKLKKDDIETKARLSAFKAKLRNDYENRLLSRQLKQLHSQTVSSLAEHWKNTMEVVNIFKGCHQTSGISPLGIVPRDNDLDGCLHDVPGRTTPWAYFGRFSIDSWYRPEEEYAFKRPQTVGPSSPSGRKDKCRPNTAPAAANGQIEDGPDQDQSHDREIFRKKTPKAEQSEQARRRLVIQLQAKAATMTRSKFLDLDNVGPIYNRNLAEAFRKKPLVKPTDKSESCVPERSDSRTPTTKSEEKPLLFGQLEYKTKDGYVSTEEAWDLNCVRAHIKKYRNLCHSSQDRRTSPVNTEKDQKELNATGSNIQSKPKHAEYPQRRHHAKVTHTNRAHSPAGRPKSRPSTKSTELKPSEEEIKEKERYVDMMSRLNRRPVTHASDFRTSKFYIPPQERYKLEQQFLMRRYFFLQRQMNKNHEDEADILAKAQTALVVKPTSSRSARLRLLAALIEQNATQRKIQRRYGSDEAMRNKVHAFLESVADFVRHSAPHESLAIAPSDDEDRVVVPKTA